MRCQLRAQINIRDNYKTNKSICNEKCEWLTKNFSNIDLEIPLTDIYTNSIKNLYFNIQNVRDYINIEAEIDLEENRITKEDLQFFKTREVMEQTYKRILCDEFEIRINDIFLALQISQPGRFDFLKIRLFVDNIEKETSYYNKILTSAITENIRIYSNKTIKTVEFNKVWKWLTEQKDFWNEVPDDKVGIFLNYFRYFNYDKSPLAIIWISMALESILVTNEKFSKSQLNGKLKIILDRYYTDDEVDKNVNYFYKFRSKIVHGKQRLFRPTILHDALDSVAKIDEELSKSGEFGYIAMILCLHLMIEKNSNDLKFNEKIIYTLID
ncbi:HEPN domain-containing protein [Clostridium sp. ZBS12]|uniref:HEPN domain-containing protein n=1 Tax=Clostridium sp. ZBS12 TaxID=2949972 RepID=UPI0020798650|nr:HEPN domain-containing protein [Clostridium sp. ZBS12]